MIGALIGLDAIFDDGEERERPDLARLMDLRRRGVCSTMAPEIFFPARGQSAAPAKVACRGCPARAECLAYAVEHREWWGVWGGTTEKERRPLNLLHGQGVALDEIVTKALAGEFDEAMVSRRTRPHRPVQPYGWRWRAQSGELVRDEAEQRVLARLRRWAEEGRSPAESAARLNAEGVCTRGGRKWAASLVGHVLRGGGPAPAVDERRAS